MIKEYVIGSLTEFEVLERTLLAEHGIKSRRAEKSVERQEIGIRFTVETSDIFNEPIEHLSAAYDIVRLENLYSYEPLKLSKISKTVPKLRRLTLRVNYSNDKILMCLANLSKFVALEELTLETALETTNFGLSCFEKNENNPLSDHAWFIRILYVMRTFVEQNKQLRSFKIIDKFFSEKIKEKDNAIYWQEIQHILSARECSIEHLEKMKKALDETRELLEVNQKFLSEKPQNEKSKKACEEFTKEFEDLKQQLHESVGRVIESKEHADIGHYFKAELIQLSEPVEAHELLSKIPENSAYYLKANNLMAHILLEDNVFSQIFHPEFAEGKELEGEEAEKFITEKLKKVIHHLRLAKIEGDEKRLFGQLLTELVTGESSLGEKTPFDKMPVEAEAAIDFLLDMLREQHSEIKKLESALQDNSVSIQVREQALRQNVLSFSPVLHQKEDKSIEERKSERSKLASSQ